MDIAAHGRQRRLSGEESAWVAAVFGLTPRKLDVTRSRFDTGHLRCMARMLKISLNSVHTYLTRAHKKLRVEDRGDLILTVMHRVETRKAEEGHRPDTGSSPSEG